jgi:hypothetical protein
MVHEVHVAHVVPRTSAPADRLPNVIPARRLAKADARLKGWGKIKRLLQNRIFQTVRVPAPGYFMAIVMPARRGSGFDTSGNVPSANNFIRAGYRMFRPACPWAFPETLYWRKELAPRPSSS